MASNTEIGKQHQEACRCALEERTARRFDSEVQIAVPGVGLHRFDLATPERDIVVECKAFTWTRGGNIPSAKITNLREAVRLLHAVPPPTRERELILCRSTREDGGETLGEYFVRLNLPLLTSVTVLEIDEHRVLRVLHSAGRSPSVPQTKPAVPAPTTTVPLATVVSVIEEILTQIEGRPRSEPTRRKVIRLRDSGLVPKDTAARMIGLIDLRNAREHDRLKLSPEEFAGAASSWGRVLEWARSRGWRGEPHPG